MTEKEYWLGFSIFPGIGPQRFDKLLEHFGSAKQIWEADDSALSPLLGKALTPQFIAFRKTFSLAGYITALEKKQVSFVTLAEEAYPQQLKAIPNPPFVLYLRGDIAVLKQSDTLISIVGARAVTSYGKEVTRIITTELVQAGCVIVSGLAMGVDAIAHATTVENNGKTIAVLGCGVDCCYPTINESLYNSILANGGVIISEFPLGAPPSKGSFPSRNRIIAGLSTGVVVTEGAEDSGTLITADFAQKFGRNVFAVPGPITSQLSKGPYKLIAKGATLVTSGKDILGELGIMNNELRKSKIHHGDTPEEQMIIDLLANEPLAIDALVRRTNTPSAAMGSILSVMELKAMIIRDPSGSYRLST